MVTLFLRGDICSLSFRCRDAALEQLAGAAKRLRSCKFLKMLRNQKPTRKLRLRYLPMISSNRIYDDVKMIPSFGLKSN